MASFKIVNGVLKIDDQHKNHLLFIVFFSIVNICNLVILLASKPLANFSTFNYFTLAIFILLLLVVICFIKTKSFKKDISFNEIEKIRGYRVFGSTRYSLLLKNSKRRDLAFKKDDVSKLSDLLESGNIKTF